MIFPEEFWRHTRGVWREGLLATRSLIDHWIQHIEGKAEEGIGPEATTPKEAQPQGEEKN